MIVSINNQKKLLNLFYEELEEEKEPNNVSFKYEESEDRMLGYKESESKMELNFDKNFHPSKIKFKNSVLSNIKCS